MIGTVGSRYWQRRYIANLQKITNYTIRDLSVCILILQQFLSKSNASDVFQLLVTVAMFIIIKLTVVYTTFSDVFMVQEYPHTYFRWLNRYTDKTQAALMLV